MTETGDFADKQLVSAVSAKPQAIAGQVKH